MAILTDRDRAGLGRGKDSDSRVCCESMESMMEALPVYGIDFSVCESIAAERLVNREGGRRKKEFWRLLRALRVSVGPHAHSVLVCSFVYCFYF